jgi:hypothetical protein
VPARISAEPRKLIRTAELRIQVENVAQALARADSGAAIHEASVTDSRRNTQPDGQATAQITLRVAAPRFDDLLTDLRRLGKVQNDVVTIDDITKQFTDLETRITVKDETVSRLRTLLGTRTGKLSDVLDLERELSRTITELEQLKGEQRYDEQLVAMSTVTVTLVEPNRVVASGVGTSAADALHHSFDLLRESATGLVYFVTFVVPWLPIAALFWWLIERARARRALPHGA